MDEELLIAATDLVRRTGCIDLEVGHSDDAGRKWYAVARYQGAKIIYESTGPDLAAFGLAVKLIDGGRCKCGRLASLVGDSDPGHCRWSREGKRFNSDCDAPPMTVGKPGDIADAERQWRQRSHDRKGPR
jgi:hypothetical protein